MAEGLAYSGGSLVGLRRLPASAASLIKSHMERAGKIVADGSASLEDRLQSIRLLHHDRLDRVKPVLTSLVDPQQPQDLQIAAIDALAGFAIPEIPSLLHEDWTAAFSPKPGARSWRVSFPGRNGPWRCSKPFRRSPSQRARSTPSVESSS